MRARRASRHKMLERMDKIERPQEASRMRLELGGWRGSNKVLDVQRVDKWFEDASTGDLRVVLEGVSFQVWHGERVGLVGPERRGQVRAVPLHPGRGAHRGQLARQRRRQIRQQLGCRRLRPIGSGRAVALRSSRTAA